VLLSAGLYILAAGGKRFLPSDGKEIWKQGTQRLQQTWQREAIRCLYPGFFMEMTEEPETDSLYEWYIQQVLLMHPLTRLQYGAKNIEEAQEQITYEMLVTGGVQDENELDETGQEYPVEELVRAENEQASTEQKSDVQTEEEEQTEETPLYSMEELSDYDFLLSHFYTVETNTEISSEELDAEKLLSMDMRIDRDVDGPQILIYHTHSQEGFVDSVPGDNSTTIVGVGAYLTELLEAKGYQVLHVTSVYDLVDGKLDRNEAYSKAYEEISGILEENPSIQAVIDLHRDGVEEGTRLVTEINGKTTAKFMFFNGLSRTKKNGPIEYLYNPYIQENLALTLQLKLESDALYPGLARNIYLKSLRYNLHLSDKALLIEAGAQTNTLQEMLNTMEPLADVLDKVFGS
jgi:stage II sporulation protein P